VTSTETLSGARFVFANLHVWITKVYLDHIALVVFHIYMELFGAVSATHRLVELHFAALIFCFSNLIGPFYPAIFFKKLIAM
jgi:hypothetical protein